MPRIYVLDVPEFAGLVDAARGDAAMRVSDSDAGYLIIDSDGPMTFNRRATGFKPAIWYGAFTGGIVGEISEFGRDTVTIVDTQAPR